MTSDETKSNETHEVDVQTNGVQESTAQGGEVAEITGTDPGLKYLRDIKLTAEEEAEYTRLAKENMAGV